MSKIKFITDSASDIPVQDERELGIQVLSFPVSFGDKTYLTRIDFDNDKFFEMLEEAPAIPTTSQITVFQYGEVFENAYNEGYTDVINTTINSEASGTYNSACLAAQMFFESHPEAEKTFRIHNVDGAGYTLMYGYAVIEGAKMARDGKSVEEILSFMLGWIENCYVYFVPYTLKYAAKSGRIPSAAAFVGELVGLKPVLYIGNRAIQTNDKIRGEKKIIPTITKKTTADMRPGAPYIVLYGNTRAEAEALAVAMEAAVGYPPVSIYQIGAAIALNAGPRTVGIATLAK